MSKLHNFTFDPIGCLKCIYYVYYIKKVPQIFTATALSEYALQVAKTIRGTDRKSAIIIHGIMPRSGTVYTGSLVKLHPDISPYPNEIWEAPFYL
jgi:hypothetical protein